MQANEIKNLKWIPVTDWSKLTAIEFDFWGDSFVGNGDIKNFVDNVFKDVARKLNISYKELGQILKEEISAFFSSKCIIFHHYSGLNKKSSHLVETQEYVENSWCYNCV